MLGDAITFPKARAGWVKTIVTGGLLLVTSVFVLPLLVLLGYHVRVVRSGVAGDANPPEFEQWGDLLVDGLKLCTIYIVYAIAPLIALAFAASTVTAPAPETVQTLQTPNAVSEPHLSPVVLGVFLAICLLTLVSGYISLAATARFAHEDRIRAAFEIRPVVRTAFTSEFFVGYVLFQAVWIVFGVVSLALLGMVVGLFLIFYTYVVTWYLIGRGYRNANARDGWTV